MNRRIGCPLSDAIPTVANLASLCAPFPDTTVIEYLPAGNDANTYLPFSFVLVTNWAALLVLSARTSALGTGLPSLLTTTPSTRCGPAMAEFRAKRIPQRTRGIRHWLMAMVKSY